MLTVQFTGRAPDPSNRRDSWYFTVESERAVVRPTFEFWAALGTRDLPEAPLEGNRAAVERRQLAVVVRVLRSSAAELVRDAPGAQMRQVDVLSQDVDKVLDLPGTPTDLLARLQCRLPVTLYDCDAELRESVCRVLHPFYHTEGLTRDELCDRLATAPSILDRPLYYLGQAGIVMQTGEGRCPRINLTIKGVRQVEGDGRQAERPNVTINQFGGGNAQVGDDNVQINAGQYQAFLDAIDAATVSVRDSLQGSERRNVLTALDELREQGEHMACNESADPGVVSRAWAALQRVGGPVMRCLALPAVQDVVARFLEPGHHA